MADEAEPRLSATEPTEPTEPTEQAYSLIFFTAQWCDPAIPMTVIFEETIRDLVRLHPDLDLRGVVVDLDEEETNQQLQVAPPEISAELLDTIDFVPMIVLLRGSALHGHEVIRLVGQLPKLVIRHQLLSALGLVQED